MVHKKLSWPEQKNMYSLLNMLKITCSCVRKNTCLFYFNLLFFVQESKEIKNTVDSTEPALIALVKK